MHIFFNRHWQRKSPKSIRCNKYSNDTTVFSIPPDFPIKINTGDSVLDNNNFSAALTIWNQNSMVISRIKLPMPNEPTVAKIYFEIRIADFNQFSDARKIAIEADADMYKKIQ